MKLYLQFSFLIIAETWKFKEESCYLHLCLASGLWEYVSAHGCLGLYLFKLWLEPFYQKAFFLEKKNIEAIIICIS